METSTDSSSLNHPVLEPSAVTMLTSSSPELDPRGGDTATKLVLDHTQLPDSTTFLTNSQSPAATAPSEANNRNKEDPDDHLQITVDTAIDSFPDLFLNVNECPSGVSAADTISPFTSIATQLPQSHTSTSSSGSAAVITTELSSVVNTELPLLSMSVPTPVTLLRKEPTTFNLGATTQDLSSHSNQHSHQQQLELRTSSQSLLKSPDSETVSSTSQGFPSESSQQHQQHLKLRQQSVNEQQQQQQLDLTQLPQMQSQQQQQQLFQQSPVTVQQQQQQITNLCNNTTTILENHLNQTNHGAQAAASAGTPPNLVFLNSASQPVSINASDIYTLTLTDGSVVQLRVQPEQAQLEQQQQQQQQQSQEELQQNLTLLSNGWPSSQDLESVPVIALNSSNTKLTNPSAPPPTVSAAEACALLRSTSSSPASIAAEVTLPFSNPHTPLSISDSATISLPSSPSGILCDDDDAHLLSPVASPHEVQPDHRKNSSSSNNTPLPVQHHRSSDSFSCSSDGAASCFDGDDDICDNETFLNMFTSIDNVTIEALKAQLTTLPEGNTDLGQLLVAAKIDLTLDDIVVPPLTHVKRIMEQKDLTDWQTQLCIKIRRRKKNTVRKEKKS